MDVKGARILAERIAAAGGRPAAETSPRTSARCVECGGPIAAILVRLGSVSCHDCRTGKLAR
jgi:hypothetical protein